MYKAQPTLYLTWYASLNETELRQLLTFLPTIKTKRFVSRFMLRYKSFAISENRIAMAFVAREIKTACTINHIKRDLFIQETQTQSSCQVHHCISNHQPLGSDGSPSAALEQFRSSGPDQTPSYGLLRRIFRRFKRNSNEVGEQSWNRRRNIVPRLWSHVSEITNRRSSDTEIARRTDTKIPREDQMGSVTLESVNGVSDEAPVTNTIPQSSQGALLPNREISRNKRIEML